MKLLLPLLLTLFALTAHADPWADDYAALLKKYVSSSGVRYAAWKADAADMQKLQGVVDGIATAKETDLAFLLNAYNALVLHGVLAKYPVKSVKDLGDGFFNASQITVAARKQSLDDLEKEIIGTRFNESRAPFALCRATRGSPRLTAQFLRPNSLNTVLTLLTGWFINDDKNTRQVGGTITLSPVFERNKASFPQGAVDFINTYRTHHLDPGSKVVFGEYDWTLNEAK